MDYDFSGWATKNDIECSDGRTIRKDAFKDNDGQKVPLVWNHQHNDPNEVLGHALLENREDGVYAYCKFNSTEAGQTAKELVRNGDVTSLSIYANKLVSKLNNVVHGCIREVSLVLAGANPGAYIDSVIQHSAESGEDEEEGTIYTDETIAVAEKSAEENNTDESNDNSENSGETIEHSDNNNIGGENKMDDEKKAEPTAEEKGKTVAEVFETLNEEQKQAVYAIVGEALEDKEDASDDKNNKEGEDEEMKHNVFENDSKNDTLAHSEIIAEAIKDAKRYGSMKESFLEHAAINNITDIDKLFPEATELYKEPKMIENDRSWVAKVMNGIKHTPFSRVKTTFGRMTEPQARAKGYIKGNKKTDIQMAILNRVTTPTTVYIKNEIDRDDVVDITDFDVVAWQKREMRKQLDKDLARAILFGDGRNPSDADKINEGNIRPILTDDDMYTIKYSVNDGRDYDSNKANDSIAKGIIRAAIRARKQYKGSGSPVFYTKEDVVTDMLLIEDLNGRRIYNTEEDLARALRVKEIVTVPELDSYTNTYGIIVNLADYTAGADKGGSINMFDDFDIDYNQMKYLIETRMSGALTVPYSAIALNVQTQSSNNNNQESEVQG